MHKHHTGKHAHHKSECGALKGLLHTEVSHVTTSSQTNCYPYKHKNNTKDALVIVLHTAALQNSTDKPFVHQDIWNNHWLFGNSKDIFHHHREHSDSNDKHDCRLDKMSSQCCSDSPADKRLVSHSGLTCRKFHRSDSPHILCRSCNSDDNLEAWANTSGWSL